MWPSPWIAHKEVWPFPFGDSSMDGRAPGYRLSPDHFQTVKRMLVPDWAQKMLCIIVPNRRTASPEFFSWVRTRRLLSRHSCPVRSPSFPNQKRRNYRWVENRFGCSAGQERYLAYSFAHNSVYLPKKTGSFQFSIQQHCWVDITVNIYFPLFWMM